VTWQQPNGKAAYAVNGEVIGPQVDIHGGNLVTGPYTANTPGTPCRPSDYRQNPVGYLDQFNPHYVPHWRGLAYLVK
jgi:hypothetical protein